MSAPVSRGRAAAARGRHHDVVFVTEAALHLIEAGGKRFRPLLTLLSAAARPRHQRGRRSPRPPRSSWCTSPRSTTTTSWTRPDAPRRPERERPLGQHHRHPHRRPPVRPRVRAGRRARRRTPCGSRPRPSCELVTGQIARPSARVGEDPVGTTSASRREDRFADRHRRAASAAMFSGRPPSTSRPCAASASSRHGLPALRRPHRHRVAVRGLGKTPGTDLREGVAPCRCSTRWPETGPSRPRLRELLAAPITDDAQVDEALTLLRSHRASRTPARPSSPSPTPLGPSSPPSPTGPARDAPGHARTLRGGPDSVSEPATWSYGACREPRNRPVRAERAESLAVA